MISIKAEVMSMVRDMRMGGEGKVMERQFQLIFGFHFFNQGLPKIILGLLSWSIISSMGSE